MKIRIWGTRGSIPTPSTPDFPTRRYGGDTTCVSVSVGNRLVILDAGTGLRLLGAQMTKSGPQSALFLFSHYHWDHIQGFPFFIPAYRDGFNFDIYSPSPSGSDAASLAQVALEGQHANLYFPVPFCSMKARLQFRPLPAKGPLELDAGPVRLVIHAAPLNHPGGCTGYRIEEHGPDAKPRAFAYLTDNEHPEEGFSATVQRLAKDADIALMDAQYTDDEYTGKAGGCPKKGWGHSTWKACLREAREAGTKRLLLSHHDPAHDDSFMTLMERGARREGAKHGIQVDAATQFAEYDLD